MLWEQRIGYRSPAGCRGLDGVRILSYVELLQTLVWVIGWTILVCILFVTAKVLWPMCKCSNDICIYTQGRTLNKSILLLSGKVEVPNFVPLKQNSALVFFFFLFSYSSYSSISREYKMLCGKQKLQEGKKNSPCLANFTSRVLTPPLLGELWISTMSI